MINLRLEIALNMVIRQINKLSLLQFISSDLAGAWRYKSFSFRICL